MRTQEQIFQYIEKHNDFFNAAFNDLALYLPIEMVKPLLSADGLAKIESGEVKWEVKEFNREAVLEEMKKYMAFALAKAEDHRGLSASRSVEHFKAWLWLLGDDDLWSQIHDEKISFAQYGVPILRAIGEKYDFPLPTGEEWFERMSDGRRCGADYECGCGR